MTHTAKVRRKDSTVFKLPTPDMLPYYYRRKSYLGPITSRQSGDLLIIPFPPKVVSPLRRGGGSCSCSCVCGLLGIDEILD